MVNQTTLINKEAEELERFVEETFNSENIDILKNLQDYKPSMNDQSNEIGK